MHSQPTDAERTFSVHLGKNVFQCFHADCAVKGNVLDLWAAIHRLPLYEAALHLAETFQASPEQRRGTRKGNPFSPNGDGQNVRPRGGHCDRRGEVTT